MENNKENQDCMAQQNATPEKKKKSLAKGLWKVTKVTCEVIAFAVALNWADDKYLNGSVKKGASKMLKACKEAVKTSKKTHVEHREHKPAVMETVFIAATEAPTYGGKRPERSFQDNGNRATDNKHYNNVQRKN